MNCAAIPTTLFEAELFGHEKGAFTGAVGKRAGALALVGEGTLLLDEVGELGLDAQAKLLRVLDDGSYRSVGASVERRSSARILAATNAPLEQRVAEGRFRGDLFERLKPLTLMAPPLRDRKEDIPALVLHALSQVSGDLRLDDDAMKSLTAGRWPGNVRELRGVVHKAAAPAEGELITTADLKMDGSKASEGFDDELERLAEAILALPIERPIEAVAAAAVRRAVEREGGNRTRAGERLGLERRAVGRRLQPPKS